MQQKHTFLQGLSQRNLRSLDHEDRRPGFHFGAEPRPATADSEESCKKIFWEKVSRSSRQRPEFQRMLDQRRLREGDMLVVWKPDRLVPSTREGARFQSLSEPWADTMTHAGKMIMTAFAGVTEFERI